MKIALVEIDGSHDECLYTQLLFVKGFSQETDLICASNMKNQVQYFDSLDAKYFFNFHGSKLKRILSVFKLWRLINKNKYNFVIFNTAQGSLIRNLMLLPYSKKINFIGVMHNGNKLIKSGNQRIINKKISKYFVLNEYVKSIQKDINNIKIASFYPIFFPKFKNFEIHKNLNEIWISIPGQLQNIRRDYMGLIASLNPKITPLNIKFLLLGKSNNQNDGTQIKKLIKDKGLESYFIFWERFIPNNEFHSYLNKSDFIMPLVSAKNEPAYLKYKISGSFNLAFAYKKPLLMEDSFSNIDDFKENAIFYNYKDINEIISTLNPIRNTYQNPKWSFEYQKNNYLEFITKP